MFKWKEYIIDKLILYKVIPQEEADVYQFGLDCLSLKLLHCISYLLIAVCLKLLPELIIIACVLIPLRRNAGGYHARTRLGCYLFSCCFVFFILVVSAINMNQNVWWSAFVLSNVIIFSLCPLDNENKKLDLNERKHFRKKALYILLSADFGSIILTMLHLYHVRNLVICGISAAALLLVLHKISDLWNRKAIDEFINVLLQKSRDF
ncbi:accessory gene regulator B [Lachnotalea glycerini]|uniref:Accessory gene regulator B n=1 Tax=Lachnotalea glycerini TaxID=1763509 RepID=A0A255IL63_9FIRM|nr:accessory gene regulator B family protein [Lachnotalea glycerini]PXV89424.1 accessory gene regulator B [Lachnotalea glycerini]RDY32387.1 accessory protein regulator B [Lachnotalea glycerini]